VVAASLLDGVDLVMLRPPARVRPSDARRLAARVRERGAVLMIVETGGKKRWPESADVRLDVWSASWVGLGAGHGNLRARRVEVLVGGRRMAGGRSRTVPLWLPGPDGGVEEAVREGSAPVEGGGPVVADPVVSVAG
jgi:hypothetical protein